MSVRTLVLHCRYTDRLSYFDDWLDSFRDSPDFLAVPVDLRARGGMDRLRSEVQSADLLVVLHSAFGDSVAEVATALPLLQSRRAPLVAFVGNEVNLPGKLLSRKIDLIRQLGAEYVATQLELEAGRWLYRSTAARVIALPHALNPAAFRPTTPGPARRVEVGVRTWRYLPILGDEDRNRLLDHFAANDFHPPLSLDISTTERFDREEWAQFLNKCKGTISTEAGSFWLDPDDAVVDEIHRWMSSRSVTIGSGSRVARMGAVLPNPLRIRLRRLLARGPVRLESAAAEDLRFDDVFERFFADRPHPPVYTKCISSRHFDAIGTKTCQIMIRGRFNGILEADRHYIGVHRDLSDTQEAVAKFRDESLRRKIVDETYEYVLSEHTYDHRLKHLRAALQ